MSLNGEYFDTPPYVASSNFNRKQQIKYAPCSCSTRSGTLAIGMTGIVYGILVIAVSVISLSTGYDYDENDTYKENLFKNLQYTAMGMGVLFIISSCLLVHGVQKENRFFQIPWLVCTGLQIVEIFIGAVMTFVSLNVTASMIFALVLNMIVGAGFCYCFFVVYQHYQLLIFLAKPEALRFEIENQRK